MRVDGIAGLLVDIEEDAADFLLFRVEAHHSGAASELDRALLQRHGEGDVDPVAVMRRQQSLDDATAYACAQLDRAQHYDAGKLLPGHLVI